MARASNTRRAVILGLGLILLLGGALLEGYIMMPPFYKPETPVRVVKFMINPGDRDQFVTRLGNFALANAFAIRVSQTSPDPNDILMLLWRKDVKMIGGNNTDTGAPKLRYAVAFFQGDAPASLGEVDRLVGRLRQFIDLIGDVGFAQTK